MIHTYNYPGSQSFRAVELADRKADTKAAAKAWWNWVHEKNGPCAPGGGTVYADREARSATWRDGSPIFDLGTTATVFAPGRVPANLPLPGWKLERHGEFAIHRIDY